MNKKEILEIRKLFTKNDHVIRKMRACYVDAEKNIVSTFNDSFHALSEGDSFKYLDLFKQTLSGSLGKNLLNMEFPLDEEKEGGKAEFLYRLKQSQLNDTALVEEFFNRIIENYDYNMNYYITLIYAVYDVPGRSSDGEEMFDASDSTYDYILCSICPVNLSKAGLSYNIADNIFEERTRDWIVNPPQNGFLYPAFNERSTDLHALLYYAKDVENLKPEFIENVLGSYTPIGAKSQKSEFNAIISSALGDECEFDTVVSLHTALNEMLEESKENTEPLTLSSYDVKNLLEKSGVEPEQTATIEQDFEENVGKDTTFLASNVAATRTFDIKTPDVIIKVNPDKADLIEKRIIDGRACLVIEINDGLSVNGIDVKI
ncbi:MAG: DUF4317 domain-containing protein [Lachnospira sp.]|nr:DUF4317 domain-containing protein [Lachnospira sp.]